MYIKDYQQANIQLGHSNEHEKSLANNFLSKTRRATLRFKKRLVSNVDELARLNKINLELDLVKEIEDENNDILNHNYYDKTSKISKKKKLSIQIEQDNHSPKPSLSPPKNNNTNNNNILSIPIGTKPRKSLNAFDVTNFYHLRKNKKYLENKNKRSFSFGGLTELNKENVMINEKDKLNNILSANYFVLNNNKFDKYDTHKSKSLEIVLNISSKRKKSSNKSFFYENKDYGNQIIIFN